MADPANWVGLLGHFGYEKALSDYIALHPDRLEDGLRAQPNKRLRQKVLRVREKMFGDRLRLDVLLRDREDKPVIVECKQESPTIDNVVQLRKYVKRLEREIGEQPRGILVHGGAKRIDRKVWRKARERPRVDVVQYKLDVDFAPSC
jgi:RecB family endonuclease NucS